MDHFLIEHLQTGRQHEAVRHDGDSYPDEVVYFMKGITILLFTMSSLLFCLIY